MKKANILSFLLVICIIMTSCGKIDKKDVDDSASASPSAFDAVNKEAATSKTEPTVETLTPDVGYADPEREISILGLKEYKKIKTKVYTDKPAKNKKFLVLFLKIRNRSYSNEYININNLSAKLNDSEVKSTYLVNQPLNYPTLFKAISSGTDSAGFVVWEVPNHWEKLEVSYDGWKYSDNIILNMTLTPEDLKTPPNYIDLD